MNGRFGQASEYVKSRQGALHLTATLITVAGLLSGRKAMTAAGVAMYGFLVFPATVIDSWRVRRDTDQRLQELERASSDFETSRDDPVRTLRQNLGPIDVQLRQLNRRVGRIEASSDRSVPRL